MGKGSRTKRERRELDHPTQGQSHVPRTRQFPIFWIVTALLVVGAIAAVAIGASGDDPTQAEQRAADAPVFADVSVTGSELATFTNNDADDPARGDRLPTIAGTRLDGMRGSIDASDGAQVIVVVAHWCPHCQDEIPRIRQWAADEGDPIPITTLSTAVSESQPNFPPAEWLAKEKWSYPVLADDEVGTAASALGVEGFPFIVFVNADGTVASRFSGEMKIDDFADQVAGIQPEPSESPDDQTAQPASTPSEVVERSVAELAPSINAATTLLVDVREIEEWNAGHAPKAVHIPLGDVEASLDRIKREADGRPIAIICRSGTRSAQAARIATDGGIANVVSIPGGMRAWVDAGQPVEPPGGQII